MRFSDKICHNCYATKALYQRPFFAISAVFAVILVALLLFLG